MKAEIKQVSITINEDEALSIINVLLIGLENKHIFEPSQEIKGGADLLELLTTNFRSSIPGIHRPKP